MDEEKAKEEGRIWQEETHASFHGRGFHLYVGHSINPRISRELKEDYVSFKVIVWVECVEHTPHWHVNV
jgi:hypothetical protein